MKRVSCILVALVLFIEAFPVSAQSQSTTARVAPAKCDAPEAAVDRAWLLFAAKHQVSTSEQGTVGARIHALSTYMQHCQVQETSQVDLTSLSEDERGQVREFVPGGPLSQLTRCLYGSAKDRAVDFVLASDVAAYHEYARSRRMGAFDEAALAALLESSQECGELVPDTLRGNELYAELNWYTRIQPNLDRIISWHAETES